MGAPVVVGRRRGGGLTNVVEAAAQNSSARAAAGAAKKRGPQFPRMCRVCPRPGRPDLPPVHLGIKFGINRLRGKGDHGEAQ